LSPSPLSAAAPAAPGTASATTAAPAPASTTTASTTRATPGGPITLVARSIHWNTTNLRLRTGQKVIVPVVNQDSVEHNFTFSAAHISKDVEDGSTIAVSFTAPAAGPYEFHRRYHPQAMHGTLTVS
jgi:plastocyanin